MRHAMLSVAICLMLATIVSAATTSDVLPPKDAGPPPDTILERVGGEDIPSAVLIEGLPFVDAGTTCGYVDDYHEACPYPEPLSPDVVYCILPTSDVCLSIDLCNSYYDSKVYVYEEEWTPGHPIACNDDNYGCADPPVEYTSWIEYVELLAGHTYYIVVDGYDGQCGDYVISIEEVECVVPCVVDCPPGAIDEVEPNGGCNDDPPTFFEPPAGADTLAVCGTCWCVGSIRDTDWYLLHLADDLTEVTICVEAEFPVILAFADLRSGCPVSSAYSYETASPCEHVCLTEFLPGGDWVAFVAPSEWIPLSNEPYTLTIEGYASVVPVHKGSWGQVKGLFR